MIINKEIIINKANLLNAISQTRAEHAIFLTTEITGLKEDLILSEAKETIKELEQITHNLEQNDSCIIDLIESFLANRWQRIRGSFLSYTSMPEGYVNQCCLTFATFLHNINPEKKKMQYLIRCCCKNKKVI
ncbi:hypothetical protein [Legionella gresilensis]|uniref:hypothetical protein n=1 Tax=Legionella gresilensis TaxID=91823 RepID=UPI00104147E5|nr:hypothetical protein [Legionella gresilensis]